MTYAIRRLSFSALAFSSLLGVACGGSDANTQPQTPGTATTTTAAPAMTGVGSTNPSEGNMATGSPAQVGGADSPMNTATPPSALQQTGMATSGQPASTGPDGRGDSAVTNDAQISGVIDAANNGEMAQARVALTKAKNPRVKQFASHMVTDHGQAESKLQSIDHKDNITPQDSPTSGQIKQGGDGVLSTLKSSSGSDFDKAYIDAQVDQHQKVLSLLDQYIPQTQDKSLQDYLKDVRSKVAMHLKMATDIQGTLSKP